MAREKFLSIKLLAESMFGEIHRIFWLIIAVGFLGGLTGAGYLKIMWMLQTKLGPAAWGPWPHVILMGATGLLIGLLTLYLGDPGNVELLVNNIHLLGGNEDIRQLRSLIPTSLISIAAGGAVGPEAPLVQTTGSIGTWLAERCHLPVQDKRILTITGMAAGLTVLFGSPLGAAIFALEILHRRGMEYYEALLPAVLGSLAGYAVFVAATGLDLAPIWSFPEMAPLTRSDIGWSVVIGVLAAAIAGLFTYLNLGLRWVFQWIPPLVRPVLGGVLLGLLAFWSPYALTFGESQITAIATAHLASGMFLVAALAKLLGSSLTLASDWKGGFIIPLFFIGAAFGQMVHGLFPQSNQVVIMSALMAGLLTGVTKTPLGSTVVVTEMAGLQLLPTTLIAAVISLLLTSEVGLIDTQRARDPGKTLPNPEAS